MEKKNLVKIGARGREEGRRTEKSTNELCVTSATALYSMREVPTAKDKQEICLCGRGAPSYKQTTFSLSAEISS